MATDLSQYEYAAYHAILRALALSPASWETEEILTSLRMVLHISDEVHLDCRQLVSNDAEIADLRELQRAQAHLGMPQSMPPQHAMPISSHSNMGHSMMPSLSMEASGGSMVNQMGGHQMPAALVQQRSLPSGAARPQYGGQDSLGPPLASFPSGIGPAIGTGTGRSTGTGARRTSTPATATAHVPSTTHSGIPEFHGAVLQRGVTSSGAVKASQAASKKGLATSKQKQNARFASAVPAGLDILESDLRGYVLERRQDEQSPWQECVVVASKREASAQRLTLVYGLDTPAEQLEHDVYLRKGKAEVLWRFVKPPRRVDGDWGAVLARDGMGLGYGEETIGTGGAGVPGSGAIVRPDEHVAGKKRKVESKVSGAPYGKEVFRKAIAAAQESGTCKELEAMVRGILLKRQSIVGQLALLRVQDMLTTMSLSTAKDRLNAQLKAVQSKLSDLENASSVRNANEDATVVVGGGAIAGTVPENGTTHHTPELDDDEETIVEGQDA